MTWKNIKQVKVRRAYLRKPSLMFLRWFLDEKGVISKKTRVVTNEVREIESQMIIGLYWPK